MSWQSHLERDASAAVDDLADFCRIPSVSTDPERAPDCRRAAEWLAARVERAGIEGVRLLESAGPPVVTGHWLHAGDAPTILVYGHYDVQPADPESDWTTPPFEPDVRHDRLYARGASDDKGNMLAPLLAAEAHLRAGGLPVNVRFFFEGEEEIGSPNLAPVFDEHAAELGCDAVYSADGFQWAEDQPSLTLALRGICGVQLDVRGPARDLHSGGYGGTVHNPAFALSTILASMVDDEGRVLIDGFYDDVEALSDADRELIARVPFDEQQYEAETGAPLFGDPAFTPRERAWARPSLEVDGMWSGATGDGRKAIIPATAHAKLSCRLVTAQDPQRILSLIERHVARHTPPGVRVAVSDLRLSSAAYAMPADHPANAAAASVLREIYGREPYYTRTGGTIAILNLFRRHLSADTVMFAFGLHDENAHAPDEFFRLASYARAQRAWGRLFEVLA